MLGAFKIKDSSACSSSHPDCYTDTFCPYYQQVSNVVSPVGAWGSVEATPLLGEAAAWPEGSWRPYSLCADSQTGRQQPLLSHTLPPFVTQGL